MLHPKGFVKPFLLLLCACLVLFAAAGCGESASDDAGQEHASVVSTEVGDDLLSGGLPVILNFGDDSQDAANTLAALEQLNRDWGGHVLIRSVDLAQNPDAKEGFPVQVMPTQFFYTAEGAPITLPMHLGMSSIVSVETSQPVFTIHEGSLNAEELLDIIEFMGVTDH